MHTGTTLYGLCGLAPEPLVFSKSPQTERRWDTWLGSAQLPCQGVSLESLKQLPRALSPGSPAVPAAVVGCCGQCPGHSLLQGCRVSGSSRSELQELFLPLDVTQCELGESLGPSIRTQRWPGGSLAPCPEHWHGTWAQGGPAGSRQQRVFLGRLGPAPGSPLNLS